MKFHLSDVLSVTTGRLVSNRHMDGIYDILGYMCGDDGITTIGLLAVAEPAKKAILDQYPDLIQVNGPTENEFLDKMLDGVEDKDELQRICNNWVKSKEAIFGEFLEIKPLNYDVPHGDIETLIKRKLI